MVSSVASGSRKKPHLKAAGRLQHPGRAGYLLLFGDTEGLCHYPARMLASATSVREHVASLRHFDGAPWVITLVGIGLCDHDEVIWVGAHWGK